MTHCVVALIERDREGNSLSLSLSLSLSPPPPPPPLFLSHCLPYHHRSICRSFCPILSRTTASSGPRLRVELKFSVPKLLLNPRPPSNNLLDDSPVRSHRQLAGTSELNHKSWLSLWAVTGGRILMKDHLSMLARANEVGASAFPFRVAVV